MMKLPSPEERGAVDDVFARVFTESQSPPLNPMAAMEAFDRARERRRVVAFCAPEQLDELQEGLDRVPDGDLVALRPVPHLRPGTVLVSPADPAWLCNDETAPTPDEGRGGRT
jgi:hypothetical protein